MRAYVHLVMRLNVHRRSGLSEPHRTVDVDVVPGGDTASDQDARRLRWLPRQVRTGTRERLPLKVAVWCEHANAGRARPGVAHADAPQTLRRLHSRTNAA